MQRFRLTLPRINTFVCPPDKRQAFLWDTEAPRLAIRATPGGKSFIFEGKLNRQTIRKTIGDIRNWNLDSAREEARRLQTLLDQGTDPRELEREKRAAKEAEKAAIEAKRAEDEAKRQYTLKALCTAYTDLLIARGKTASAASAKSAFRLHVFEAFPALAETQASAITPHQIAAIVRKLYETGHKRAAGMLRSFLSAAYNAAKKSPFNPALPADLIAFNVESNPVDAVPAIPVECGEHVLSATDLQAYVRALDDSSVIDQALKVALYAGGQRMAQLLRAKVSDYDPQEQTLRLWDGKGKRKEARQHVLPLAPTAAAIVSSLIERAKSKNPDSYAASLLLFTTHGKVPLSNTTPGKRAGEISAAMKCVPFNLRDIRRTVETMLAGMGISRDTRAQLLSHGISGVQSAHYDRYDYTKEKRAALVAWEKRLAQIVSGEESSNVIQLREQA